MVAAIVAVLAAGFFHPVPAIAAKGQPRSPEQCQTAMFGKAAPATRECAADAAIEATAVPSGFQETVVWSGLTNPTVMRFAADGRVFVGEKSGLIKVFDSLSDPTPTVFSQLTTNVQNFWDRGLLGLALDPSLTGGPGPVRPWVYVLYTYDHILGDPSPAPRWGDACPTPPGPTTDGCTVSARLSRFTVSGSTISGPETVLLEDWCQQYPSHSIGTLAFGPDGALYVSGGDGASFTAIDYGQLGGSLAGTPTPRNPCGDPPGGTMSPPDAAGGALRSQDVRGVSAGPGYASLVASDGAVAYWRLGETSGTLADDAIGASDGSYVGTPTRGATGALNGDSNTAVTFPTASSYVQIGDRAALDVGNGPWSIEFWYKPTTAGQIRYILSKGNQFNVYMNPSGNLTVDNDNTAAVQVGPGKGIGSQTGVWHHYVITRSGSGAGNTKIYQDGIDVTNFASDQTFSSNAAALFLGRYYDGSFPALGTLDEVALYPTALTAAKVQSHLAAAFPTAGGDPTGLDGAILRLDPVTGAAMPDNPMASSSDPNSRRIIAFGLRNPFRFTMRPGTNELWLGDVGAGEIEEINRIANIGDSTVENFGWPCYEGVPRNSGYDNADVALCETLYGAGPSAVTNPVYGYLHTQKVIANETCPTGSSAIAGMAFYPETGGAFPASYRGGLFFADHNRSCIWFMPKGANGQPDPNLRQAFAPGAANPVDLVIGPDSLLYYVDFDTSTIRRIGPVGNLPPTARIVANPTSGAAPLTVNFSGTTSTDPEGGPLTYRWDLDGDGAYDDSTSATPSRQYTTSGTVTVGLEVTDNAALTGTTSQVITVDSTPNTPPTPVIDTPAAGTTFSVGDLIQFTGHANDTEDGALAPARLTWTLNQEHCPSNCHTHTVQTFPGIASGSFNAPDHDYPSFLNLVLTATDSDGASASVTLQIDPNTVDLQFATNPTGLDLTVGTTSNTAPFSQTFIDGSLVSLAAPQSQVKNGTTYAFDSWSDGGNRSHTVTAGDAGSYTATYTEVVNPGYSGLVAADGAVAYWRLGEASGSVADDAIGAADGNYVGTPTKGVAGALPSDPDTAVTFPTATSYVQVADRAAIDFGNGPWSIEFWYKPTSASSIRYLISKGTQFNVYMNPSGYLTVDNDNTAAVQVAPGKGIGTQTGVWHHYVITRTGSGAGNTRIYQDGVDVTNFASDQTFSSNNRALSLARYYDGSFPALGTLDEVALYPTALSAAKVQAHYAAR